MECRDVAIIGAGPAGASAALELERMGVDHILIDKATFPRPKICAGVLPPAISDLLGELPKDVFESRLRGYYLHSISGRNLPSRFHRRGYAVDRMVFDRWLVSKLSRRPVEGRLLGIDRLGTRLTFRTEKIDVHCKVLIGADGANSKVRSLCGIAAPRMAMAYQAEVPMETSEIERRTESWFHIFYFIPGGYGWVAPHRHRLMVGTGSILPGAVGKMNFSRFLRHPAVVELTGGHRAGKLQAHRIPMSGPLKEPGCGGTILAGDAGGFVFPGTGEGVRYAILSGRAAARAAAENLKEGGRPSRTMKKYIGRLRDDGLLSLGDVDFLDMLRSPKSAESYVRKLTSLSRRASSSLPRCRPPSS